MPTKLGFQLHAGQDSVIPTALDRLALMRPKALWVLDNPDLLNTAYDRIGAGPLYLHQADVADDLETYLKPFANPTEAANQYLDFLEPTFGAIRWAYHATPPAQRITPATVEFEAAAIRLAAERYNVRLCVGNFATGTPQVPEWGLYQPVLETAARYGALIGLQELYPILPYIFYGPNANIPNTQPATPQRLQNEIPYPQKYTQAGQIVGRYRHLRDYCRKQRIPVRIIISQMGAGRVLPEWLDRFGRNVGYWRTLPTVWRQFGINNADTRYLQDLVWLDQHVYSQDAEVVATCLLAWNSPLYPEADIANSRSFLDRLQIYLLNAQTDQPVGYEVKNFPAPESYQVIVPRLRVRTMPSMNTKFIGSLDYGETITATQYAFSDGVLWLKHQAGWSAYTNLVNGNPDYENKYVEGKLITTPRQDASVNNFVGTIEEVRRFMQAHKDQLFYIAIDPTTPPQGARQFRITVFPADQGRKIIDQLHPAAGDPLFTPSARTRLRNTGQL